MGMFRDSTVLKKYFISVPISAQITHAYVEDLIATDVHPLGFWMHGHHLIDYLRDESKRFISGRTYGLVNNKQPISENGGNLSSTNQRT